MGYSWEGVRLENKGNKKTHGGVGGQGSLSNPGRPHSTSNYGTEKREREGEQMGNICGR